MQFVIGSIFIPYNLIFLLIKIPRGYLKPHYKYLIMRNAINMRA